ncbi:hypothetical protein NBRC116494_01090 [Aurantivibrio plasticivorans]
MIEYALIKTVHIGALILWLGPALGAWLVLRAIDQDNLTTDTTARGVVRIFYSTVVLEHIAFLVLIGSGTLLALNFDFWGSEWLQQKLLILLIAIIPLEIIDIYLGNWVAMKASSKIANNIDPTSWEKKGLSIYHGIFTKIALSIIPVAVTGIIFLAAGKSPIF